MRVDTLPKIRRLNPDLVPPREAKPVGLHTDGRMIYEMKKLDLEKTSKNKVQLKDAGGQPLFRKDAQGGSYPVMQSKPVYYTSRFVLERSGTGKVSMNEHFEPSKESLAANKLKAEQADFTELLAKEAHERGLTPQDLVGRLLDPIKHAGPGQVIVEGEDFPVHRGGAHWILSDGGTFKGKREGAKRAETEISGKVFDGVVEVEALEPDNTEF